MPGCRAIALLALSLAVGACSKASPEGEAKQWQEPPPPKGVKVPAGLAIPVEIDGAPAAPITSELLQSTKPDFLSAEHRAWRIPTIIAAASPAGTVVEATGPAGVAVKFQRPSPEGFEPVLFLTRRGELIVAALDPADPFPRYHGQGARMRRPGDSMPRVAPVTKLSITTSTP